MHKKNPRSVIEVECSDHLLRYPFWKLRVKEELDGIECIGVSMVFDQYTLYSVYESI